MMEVFLDAPFPALRGQALDNFVAIYEGIVFPQDARLVHLLGLGAPVLPVFQPVLQNPDAYLMLRLAPFEELPDNWEEFYGNNYLGVQQHLQEVWDAPEQVEDIDDEEDVDDLTPDDRRLLKDIDPQSSSVATIGLQGSAMPGASPASFGSTLESATGIRTDSKVLK